MTPRTKVKLPVLKLDHHHQTNGLQFIRNLFYLELHARDEEGVPLSYSDTYTQKKQGKEKKSSHQPEGSHQISCGLLIHLAAVSHTRILSMEEEKQKSEQESGCSACVQLPLCAARLWFVCVPLHGVCCITGVFSVLFSGGCDRGTPGAGPMRSHRRCSQPGRFCSS